MRDKTIKIIYFSLQGSEVKSINLSWKRILSIMFSSFVVMLLLVGSSLAVFTGYFKDQRITKLRRANTSLTTQLHYMGDKVSEIERQLQIVEKHDDDLRIFAEMPRLEPDLRKVGTGGTRGDFIDADLGALPEDLREETSSINQLLADLESRLSLHFDNVADVKQKILADKSQLQHTPSIRPVLSGRITDRYGKRLDPFLEKVKHHNGIDISAEIGTEVYAAAAGVVVQAQTTFSRGRGYGKVVLIDHGYGYKTLYGHLSEVKVKPGQKLDRWDVIALVGNTGRTTGPHLHFEVHKNNLPVDPQTFIIE